MERDLTRGQGSAAKPARSLRVVGLFSGIGGLEAGLRAAGHTTELMCEVDPAARAVLTHEFPDAPLHPDVRTLRALPGCTELLVAGFPCQDLSQAGRTAGLDGERSGLVEHVFRLLRTKRVPLVLLENVRFMLRIGKGRAMDTIVRRFERLGYSWAYRVVDTNGFGLPQRRERVFFLASLAEDPRAVLMADDAGLARELPDSSKRACGFYWSEGNHGLGWAVDAIPPLKGGSNSGGATPPGILLPSGKIVKPDVRDAERLQGFRVDWTKPGGRERARWRLVGNAVSVPVATWIGHRLASPGSYLAGSDAPLSDAVWPDAAWRYMGRSLASSVSTWPVTRRRKPLHQFLQYDGTPLSAKATLGFLTRAEASTLRLPPGFLERVARHLVEVQGATTPALATGG